MSLFGVTGVYRIESTADGHWVDLSDSDVRLEADEVIADEQDALRPLHVFGLQLADFAVTVDLLPDEKGAELVTHGYFVTQYYGGEGIIVPGDLLERHPKTWLSPWLVDMIKCLPDDEFAQFTVPKLADYVRKTD